MKSAAILISTMSRLRRDGIVSGPASADSVENCFVSETGFIRPLLQCLRSTKRHYVAIVRAVVLLLLHRRPSTIARLVIAMRIYAINGVLFARRIAHIGVKALERVPQVAHLYSFSAVPFIGIVLIICASGFHSRPNVPHSGMTHSVRCASGDHGCRNSFFIEASA